MAEPRIRHSADEAKQLILAAAEKRFREGGVFAVRVQLVARDLGLTDAAIHHHFGSRKGLLTALLRRAGRRVRAELETAIRGWSGGSRDLASLSKLISDCYDRRGYARLATWLMLSGVTGRGSGMLSDLVDALQRGADCEAQHLGLVAPTRAETQFAVALFHLIHAAEPLFGEAMLRSAGLPNDAASRNRFQAWWLTVFEDLLAPKPPRDHARVRTLDRRRGQAATACFRAKRREKGQSIGSSDRAVPPKPRRGVHVADQLPEFPGCEASRGPVD
jgi:AcrR family transcriptional regulator